MSKSLDKDISLLKRRIKYFISKNGGSFDVEKWGNPTDKKSFIKSNNKLKEARKSYSLNKKSINLINEAKILGVKLNKDIKTEKDYKEIKNKVTYQKKIKLKNNISKKDSDKFMNEVQKYNQTIVRKDMHKRLNLRPRTVEELIKFKKILEAAKKGNYELAKKLLGGSANENMHRASINQDSFRASKAKSYSYQDWIFLKTSIQEAESSVLPELAKLFREGKEGLVLELSKNKFAIYDYSESFKQESDDFDGKEYILAGLKHVRKNLSEVNKKLVNKFIKKITSVK